LRELLNRGNSDNSQQRDGLQFQVPLPRRFEEQRVPSVSGSHRKDNFRDQEEENSDRRQNVKYRTRFHVRIVDSPAGEQLRGNQDNTHRNTFANQPPMAESDNRGARRHKDQVNPKESR
jgi:hypothetical protein